MTKEEVLSIMNNLYVGCKVAYNDHVFEPYSSLKTGTIVEIKKHKLDRNIDPVCEECIGHIRIKRDDGSILPLQCMVGYDGRKYELKIKDIIMDDFLKEEEFEI